MMLAVATTLATVLLPGAFAIPEDSTASMHRALQATVDANGDHHLYFHSIDPLFRQCSHVDAAPFMPAALFEPENIVALWTYLTATRSLYTSPTPGPPRSPLESAPTSTTWAGMSTNPQPPLLGFRGSVQTLLVALTPGP
jgi:hypothetical protein